MKNQLFERITRTFAPPARSLALLFAICAIGATHTAWATDTININFCQVSSADMRIADAASVATPIGTVPGDAWAQSTQNGASSAYTFTSTKSCTVTGGVGVKTELSSSFSVSEQLVDMGNHGQITTSAPDMSPVLKSWIGFKNPGSDLARKSSQVVVSNIPYDCYDAIVILSGYTTTYYCDGVDNSHLSAMETDFPAVTVNDTSYTYANGATVAGSANWGVRGNDNIEIGTNALRIKGLSGTLTLSLNAADFGIAGVQIINTAYHATNIDSASNQGGYAPQNSTLTLAEVSGTAEVGAVVKVSKIYTAVEGSGKTVPEYLQVNGVKSSAKVYNTTAYATGVYKIEYNFDDGPELVVGVTYPVTWLDSSNSAITTALQRFKVVSGGGNSMLNVPAIGSSYSAVCGVNGVVISAMPQATLTVDGSNNATFTLDDPDEDACYVISANATYNTITFDIPADRKICLFGSYTLTSSSTIEICDSSSAEAVGGTVEMVSASTLSGTLKGDGAVAYVGVLPSGLTYSSAEWTGTVWLKNVSVTGFRTDTYANSGSKVKVSGVSGWIAAGTDNSTDSNAELILEDDVYGFAFKVTDANSLDINHKDRFSVWKKLSGSGTLTAAERSSSSTDQTPAIKVYDASDFNGNIVTASSASSVRRIFVIFCNDGESFGSTYLYDTLYADYKGCIYVSSNATVNVAAGANWAPIGGFYVDGPGSLNIAGGTLCNTLYGSATVTAASTASSLTIADGSSLTVNAALSGSVTVANGGSVDVAATSSAAFTVASGGTLNVGADITGAVSVTGVCNTIGNVSLSSSANVVNQAGVLNVYPALGSTGTTSFDAYIKGTVNIEANATLKSLGGDMLWYNADSAGGIVNVKANGTLDMDVTRWTIGPYNQINLYEGATVTGTGDSYGAIDMNKWSSSDVVIHAYGNATIGSPIRSVSHTCGVFEVESGKTLTFSGRLFDNKTTKRGLGTLKLTYANGNAGTTTGAGGDSYTVPTLEEGVIEFAGAGNWSLDVGEARDLSGYAYSGTGSIAVSATQTGAEYALGSDIVFENVASASLVPTVTLRTGGTVTPVLDGTTATSAGTGTVSIDGAATDLDLTCTNTIDFAYASFTGASTSRDYAPVYTEDGVYARASVYTTGSVETFLANNSSSLTLVVVGQMSPTANTIFLSLGSSNPDMKGLVIVRTSNKDEVMIGYNDAKIVHEITRMTVPNCATARHAYIITKQDEETTTTFTVYLDGIKWKTLTIAKLTLTGGGVQIGADFGGKIRNQTQSEFDDAAFITIPNSESETGVLNVMRMYGRVITPTEIAAYATTYPYVSPNGSSTRMFTTGAENWIDTTEASEVWMNSTGGNSGTPTVGANVTVVAQADTVITVNLESTTEYEGLTVNENSVKFVPASTSSGAVKITGMTVIGTVVTNAYGAVDMSGGPMTITEDGDITFDYSAYDASAIYTTTDIPLTSDVDEDSTKVHLIAPVTPYRTYSLVYTDDHYAMQITPITNPGSVVYYTGGYWGTTESTFAVTNASGNATIVFPGDTVVIPAYYDGTSSYFGSPLPANVTSIRVEKDYTFESGVDDTAILGGGTVTVADGCTLTFATSWHNLTLGAVTFNGPGSVAIPSLSSVASITGAVSGTAPLAIGASINVASGGSIANTISGSGTLTFATLPASALSLGTWTGTVVLPAISSGEVNFNNYGKAGSTVRLSGGMSGDAYLANETIAPTIDIPSGQAMTLTAFSPSFANTINALTGAGTFSITATATEGNDLANVETWETEGYSAYFLLKDISGFTGSLSTATPGIAIGSAKPSINTAGSAILVSSGVTATIGSSATWTAGDVKVEGELKAPNLSYLGGATTVTTGDNGVFTLTNTANVDDVNTDYARIQGVGTLKFEGTGYRTISTNNFPTAMVVENNLTDGFLHKLNGVEVTIGSLAGDGKIRSDWNSGSRDLKVLQARNTTYSGLFDSSIDRIGTFKVAPGETTAGTLTLSGTQTADNALEIQAGASVNLTGTWVGATTVAGTFGGTGTVSGAVTFANGSTFKVFEASGYGDSAGTTYLKATGGVTVAAGNVVWVEAEQTPYAGMVLMDFGENAAPAGTFRFANETYRSSWVPKVSGNQLVVAAHTSETINVASGSQDFADSYFDCTVTKTGAGVARLTGALDNVTLDIQAGTLDLACSSASGLTITGAGTLKLAMNIDLTSATFTSFTGAFDIAYGVRVTVTEAIKNAILASAGEGVEYNVVANKDGTYTISVKAPDTIISFASNDPGVVVTVPADGDGVNYITSYGKVTGVEIDGAPVTVTGLSLNDRIAPYTISVDVTIPETSPDGYKPVILSWDYDTFVVDLIRNTDGTLQAATGNDGNNNVWTSASNNASNEYNTVTLEAGKTYNMVVRHWGVEGSWNSGQNFFNYDNGTPQKSRGYSAPDNTGTSVWIDGKEVIHCCSLRYGTISSDTDTTGRYATRIYVGASAKDGNYRYDGLVVNGAGFLNERGTLEGVEGVESHPLFMTGDTTGVFSGALPSIQSSDALATYKYDYGVAPLGVSGGYRLTRQSKIYHHDAGAGRTGQNVEYDTRGVIMSHTQEGATKVTLTISVDISEGSAGGTICEMPIGSETIALKYDGSTDKFGVAYGAYPTQWQTSAAGDGAHVLVLTYDSSAGIYLWVDSYDENNTHSNTDVAIAASLGASLGDTICFGSKSDATDFFAGLCVVYQNVQFGVAVCDEEDVEAALESFNFGPEISSMPLSERLKYLPNVSTDGATIAVPTITVSGKVITGYAALNAARSMGVYTNYVTTLQMSGYDSSSGNMACAVDPAFAGKMSVSLAGSTNGLVWTRLNVQTIAANQASVSLPLSSNAFGNGGDYSWFKVLEEPYTNGAPVEAGRIHERLANTPTSDYIFRHGETSTVSSASHDCYRIPAIASSWTSGDASESSEAAIIGIYDARTIYWDLGQRIKANTNARGYANDSGCHYVGVDIAGNFSLDGGETWSYPQIMIDVPNCTDTKTGSYNKTQTTGIDKAYDLGDPSIVYDPENRKFIMMGITGGGNTTVGADAVDVVTYDCSLASVKSGAPNWTNRTSVKNTILTKLRAKNEDVATEDPPNGFNFSDASGSGAWTANKEYFISLLQGPGNAIVTRIAKGGVPAGTVVFPMQYIKKSWNGSGNAVAANYTTTVGVFATYYLNGEWEVTDISFDAAAGGGENCIVQLDDGSLLMEVRPPNASTARAFFRSADFVSWSKVSTSDLVTSVAPAQGSFIRIGSKNGHSVYACSFATSALRGDLKLFIGTDTGSGAIEWQKENSSPVAYCTIWEGPGEASGGENIVYGYSSLVMLNPTTLGVLFEANGHIYFTKVDVAGALQ